MTNPFPLPALPDPLASYVTEGAAALDCDPSYVAVPLLPVTASAIGNTRRVRLKPSWSEPAVIWAATVGESGTVKSPALELATAPLWLRQAKLLREYGARRARYDAEVKAWKSLKRDERGEEPEVPDPCEHVVCADVTVEALTERLLDTPRGTCVAPDELGAWFGSFNQYKIGGADVSHWLAMHGARALKVDRKTGDRRTIYVAHAAVCVTGTIQPATLRRALRPEYFENGLAARLLVSMPRERAKRWTEHGISEHTRVAVDALFRRLFELRSVAGPHGDEPGMVDLDEGARDDWIAFVNTHNEQLQAMTGHARAAWAKLEGYTARFALMRHCVREAAGGKESVYIDRSDVEAGIALARWFGAEALRVYHRNAETDDQRERRESKDLIYRLGGRVTPRDLKEHCRRFPTSEAAEVALQALVDSADGAWEPPRQGARGRPAGPVFVLADSPDYPFRVPENTNSNGKSHFPERNTRAGSGVA